MSNNFYMSDEDLKILKKAINQVKRSKIYKELQEARKKENKEESKASSKAA